MFTREEFIQVATMVEEMHRYIFSDNFMPRRGEVRLTSTELKRILNIPSNTYSSWMKKKLLPHIRENGRILFIATEINQAIIDRRINRDDRYVEEFRRNYIYDVR